MIVKLYEYVPPGEPGFGAEGYIVLEYVEGRDGEGTLEELFGAGPVPVVRLIRIVAIVAETLHHAHTHADPRGAPRHEALEHPARRVQGEPRVCDFGLAIDEEIQRLHRERGCGDAALHGSRAGPGRDHRGSTAAPTSGPWASSSTGG